MEQLYEIESVVMGYSIGYSTGVGTEFYGYYK